jgi:hypothetical protein
MKPSEILSDPANWRKDCLGRTSSGPCCIAQAIVRDAVRSNYDMDEAIARVCKHLGFSQPIELFRWNDGPATHAEVLAALKACDL